MKVAWTEITRSNREVKENAHTPADLALRLVVTWMVSVRPELGVLRLRVARQAFPVLGVIAASTAVAMPDETSRPR